MAKRRVTTNEELVLIHDASSNMAKQKFIWDTLVDPTMPPAVIGYDRRRMAYPVAVSRTLLEDSANWAGLQLADVIAGAVARSAGWLMAGKDHRDDYAQQLFAIIGRFKIDPVLPEDKITPEELGTVGPDAENPIDYYQRTIFQKD